MSKIKSGSHLSVVRSWIQRNALNGESVTWGSEQFLQLKSQTVSDLENLAQEIRDAVEAENKPFLKGKEAVRFNSIIQANFADVERRMMFLCLEASKQYFAYAPEYKEATFTEFAKKKRWGAEHSEMIRRFIVEILDGKEPA